MGDVGWVREWLGPGFVGVKIVSMFLSFFWGFMGVVAEEVDARKQPERTFKDAGKMSHLKKTIASCHFLRRFAFTLEDLDLLAVYLELSKVGTGLTEQPLGFAKSGCHGW